MSLPAVCIFMLCGNFLFTTPVARHLISTKQQSSRRNPTTEHENPEHHLRLGNVVDRPQGVKSYSSKQFQKSSEPERFHNLEEQSWEYAGQQFYPSEASGSKTDVQEADEPSLLTQKTSSDSNDDENVRDDKAGRETAENEQLGETPYNNKRYSAKKLKDKKYANDRNVFSVTPGKDWAAGVKQEEDDSKGQGLTNGSRVTQVNESAGDRKRTGSVEDGFSSHTDGLINNSFVKHVVKSTEHHAEIEKELGVDLQSKKSDKTNNTPRFVEANHDKAQVEHKEEKLAVNLQTKKSDKSHKDQAEHKEEKLGGNFQTKKSDKSNNVPRFVESTNYNNAQAEHEEEKLGGNFQTKKSDKSNNVPHFVESTQDKDQAEHKEELGVNLQDKKSDKSNNATRFVESIQDKDQAENEEELGGNLQSKKSDKSKNVPRFVESTNYQNAQIEHEENMGVNLQSKTSGKSNNVPRFVESTNYHKAQAAHKQEKLGGNLQSKKSDKSKNMTRFVESTNFHNAQIEHEENMGVNLQSKTSGKSNNVPHFVESTNYHKAQAAHKQEKLGGNLQSKKLDKSNKLPSFAGSTHDKDQDEHEDDSNSRMLSTVTHILESSRNIKGHAEDGEKGNHSKSGNLSNDKETHVLKSTEEEGESQSRKPSNNKVAHVLESTGDIKDQTDDEEEEDDVNSETLSNDTVMHILELSSDIKDQAEDEEDGNNSNSGKLDNAVTHVLESADNNEAVDNKEKPTTKNLNNNTVTHVDKSTKDETEDEEDGNWNSNMLHVVTHVVESTDNNEAVDNKENPTTKNLNNNTVTHLEKSTKDQTEDEEDGNWDSNKLHAVTHVVESADDTEEEKSDSKSRNLYTDSASYIVQPTGDKEMVEDEEGSDSESRKLNTDTAVEQDLERTREAEDHVVNNVQKEDDSKTWKMRTSSHVTHVAESPEEGNHSSSQNIVEAKSWDSNRSQYFKKAPNAPNKERLIDNEMGIEEAPLANENQDWRTSGEYDDLDFLSSGNDENGFSDGNQQEPASLTSPGKEKRVARTKIYRPEDQVEDTEDQAEDTAEHAEDQTEHTEDKTENQAADTDDQAADTEDQAEHAEDQTEHTEDKTEDQDADTEDQATDTDDQPADTEDAVRMYTPETFSDYVFGDHSDQEQDTLENVHLEDEQDNAVARDSVGRGGSSQASTRNVKDWDDSERPGKGGSVELENDFQRVGEKNDKKSRRKHGKAAHMSLKLVHPKKTQEILANLEDEIYNDGKNEETKQLAKRPLGSKAHSKKPAQKTDTKLEDHHKDHTHQKATLSGSTARVVHKPLKHKNTSNFLYPGILVPPVMSPVIMSPVMIAPMDVTPTVLPVGNDKPTTKFTYYELSNAQQKGAVCIDGSTPRYYFRKGFDHGKSKWIMYLQGGAWCESKQSCLERSTTELGSSLYFKDLENPGGLLSGDQMDNPTFFDWNLVYLPYCDGSSFAGNRSDPVEVEGEILHFRGKRILSAAMDDLLKSGMRHAQEVVLSGTSAGGLAVMLHADYIRHRLPTKVHLHSLADSGFFLDIPTHKGYKMFRKNMQNVFKLHDCTSGVNQKCVSSMAAKDLWKCIFPQYFLPFVKSPLYMVNPIFDSWQLENVYQVHCAYHVDTCTKKEKKEISKFGRQAMDALTSALHNSPTVQMYADACVDHGQVISSLKWNDIKVKNTSISDAFTKWYKHSNKKTVRSMVDDTKFLINPTCV